MKKKNIFINSTLANWFNTLNIFIYNIFSVPIILSKWEIEKFGVWILLNSIFSYLYLLNLSLEQFTFSENLKLGKKKIEEISKNISNGILFSIIISFVLIIIIFLLDKVKIVELVNVKNTYLIDIIQSIIIYTIFTSLTYSIFPFISDALVIFGYQHIFIWFRSINKFISNSCALFAIYYFNTSIIQTVVCMVIVESLSYTFMFIYSYKVLTKEKLNLTNIDFKKGLSNFIKSILVFINNILNTITAQGLRIIISSLLSSSTLAIFTVTRTISNAFMQSVQTLADPMLPNLMESFVEKKNEKLNNYFNLYFIFISLIFCPILFIINLYIIDIFNFWTLNKILFNEFLYFFLICGVAIYSISLPLKLVLTGNNLNKEKIFINFISIVTMAISIISTYQNYLIISFGFGLFVFELASLFLNFVFIKKFFKKNFIDIDFKVFFISLVILTISLTLILFNLMEDSKLILIALILYLIACIIIFINTSKNLKLLIKAIIFNK